MNRQLSASVAQSKGRSLGQFHRRRWLNRPCLAIVNHRTNRSAFTLMEVMVACGIFFMSTFAILALVSTTLRNARMLQRRDIDAGMAASQVFETLKTNRMEQGSLTGDFGEAYSEYTWDAAWDLDWDSGATNGLLKVDIVVNRRGNRQPIDALTIRVFAPDAKSGVGPNLRP